MNNSLPKKILALLCSWFTFTSLPTEAREITHPNTESSSQLARESQESTTPSETREQNITPEQQQAIAELIHTLDTSAHNISSLYQGLDSVIEQVAHMITRNVIKIANKEHALKALVELRTITQQCGSYKEFEVNPEALYTLLHIHEYLLNYLDTTTASKFKSLPSIDINSIIKRGMQNGDFSLEDLQKKINTQQQKLAVIAVRSTSIGLTWYNKLFRKLSDIDHNYRLFTIGAKAGFSTLTAAVFYAYHTGFFKHDENNQDTSLWFRLGQKLIGTAPTNRANSVSFDEYVTDKHTDETIRTFHGAPGALGLISKYLTEKSWSLRFVEGAAFGYNTYLWHPEILKVSSYLGKKGRALIGKLKGGIERTAVEEEQRVTAQITFDDVVGLDHAKQVLAEIVNYLRDPERYDLLGMTPEKGFLLCGPSRTGKSYIAEALAGEIRRMQKEAGRDENDIRFYSIDAEKIITMGMKTIFELAEACAPCVLFIDEIDLLGLQRADGNRELLGQFLSGLSGFQKNNPRKKVIVVAATNKPENIDEALRKSGRFGKIIRFDYPTKQERKEYMLRKLTGLAVNLRNFDLDTIVDQTEHCTFEDLNKMLASALLKAKILGRPLNQQLLLMAFQEEILSIINQETRLIPESERDILVAHVVGQACAHLLLGCSAPLNCVTIRSVGRHIVEKTVFERLNSKKQDADSTVTQTAIEYGGVFVGSAQDSISLTQRKEWINKAKTLLAGNCAEKILLGSCGYSYKPEQRQQAFDIIKRVVFGGLELNDLSKQTKEQLLKETFDVLLQCEQEVETLLTQHKDALNTIAEQLKKQLTLSGRQVAALLKK
ncbi:AAA family ATPase [Candidatus Dependentiae bacterium]|nr:AAA family ATPase [Candidatus Dependentiae bacterium]